MTLFWEAPGLGQREDPAICPRMDTPAHRVTRSCRHSLSNPACVPDHRAQVAQGHGRDAYPVWKPDGGCRHLTGARPTHAVKHRVAGARQRPSGRPRWCSATCGSRTAPPPAASPRGSAGSPRSACSSCSPARLARPAARADPSGPGHRRPAHADRRPAAVLAATLPLGSRGGSRHSCPGQGCAAPCRSSSAPSP